MQRELWWEIIGENYYRINLQNIGYTLWVLPDTGERYKAELFEQYPLGGSFTICSGVKSAEKAMCIAELYLHDKILNDSDKTEKSASAFQNELSNKQGKLKN